MAVGNERKMTPHYRKKKPRDLRKHHYSQNENPRLSLPESDMKKQKSGRKCITSTHNEQFKWNISDTNPQRFQSEVTSSYAHKNIRVQPKSNTAASHDLRATILSKRANRDSRASTDFRVMTLDEIRRNKAPRKEGHYSDMEETETATVNAPSEKNFKSGCIAEESGDASEAMFQAKQKSCKSNINIQEYRTVCGNKVTVIFNRKVNSEYNGKILVQPARFSHTVNRAPPQIRKEDKFPGDDTSSCSMPKKMPLVSDCLRLKQTEDGLRNVGGGKNFLVSESNRNEKDYLDQTNQMISDMKREPRISSRKRKNTDPTDGPPLKRPRLVPPTADSLQGSEVTPQVNGCSDLSKLNGKSDLVSGESSCFGLGQPVTDISEESYKSCSVLLMNKSSSISFNTAGCGAAQSIDPPSHTTSPLITSELSGKHPGSSFSGLGDVIHVTHTSKSQSSQRLEPKLALSTSNEKSVSDGNKKELEISRTEMSDMDTDEELLLLAHDDDDISVALDTEEDIPLEIDDIINDTFL
jgi:hypothetical protein